MSSTKSPGDDVDAGFSTAITNALGGFSPSTDTDLHPDTVEALSKVAKAAALGIDTAGPVAEAQARFAELDGSAGSENPANRNRRNR